ncbi:sterile alpha motif domain-containing protein 15 [Rhynchocyon petersi]
MAEVPEDYDSGPDDDEDLSSETSGWPQILQMAEVTKSDSIMEAGPDLPPEIEEEPWPETEEDDLKAGPSKNFEDIQLTPARTPEEGISKELDVDVPIGIEADTSRETLKEMEGEHFRDGEVLMDEKREEWDLLPKGEIIIHFTEEALTESVMEADHKLPEENKPEVLGSTFSEIKLELPEEPKSEVSEELIGEQDEIVIESPENIEPEFPIDTPRKYVDETNLPPTKMTTPEVPQETQRKSSEEAGLEPPEETRPEVPEETQRKSSEEVGLEPPEEIRPEVPEETQRKSSEEAGLEPPEETRPEVPEETQRKSKFEVDLVKFFSETNIADLSEEVKESLPEKAQPRETTELQFEYLHWSPNDVAEWIGHLGFPQYKECFTANFISGRKLIYVNCSNLPQMGITDFEDMKVISGHARDLLGIEEPFFKRSITLPHRDNIGLFLEQKSRTGVKANFLTFPEFVQAAGLQDYVPQITSLQRIRHSTSPSHNSRKPFHLA